MTVSDATVGGSCERFLSIGDTVTSGAVLGDDAVSCVVRLLSCVLMGVVGAVSTSCCSVRLLSCMVSSASPKVERYRVDAREGVLGTTGSLCRCLTPIGVEVINGASASTRSSGSSGSSSV